MKPSRPILSRILLPARHLSSLKSVGWLPALLTGLCAMSAVAQDDAATLSEVIVEAEADALVQGPFLPAVEGTRINSGKKSSLIDLDAFPRITNNNYRQALALTPGLYLSEETTPLISIGYRGLDPHRVQFTQVLKDGVPIHADQFGYPEAYYTPPLDTVDRIEFLRGGASLMYGPQPGGALNYVTHRPRLDRPFSFGTTNTFGSDDYYSNFTYLDGTSGRLGYYAYYNHRQGDGFRTANSDFDLNAAHLKLVLDGSTDSRWILTLEGYEEEHGEPGGLTFATGPNAVNYDANRDAASRLNDRFELKRYFASLAWERDFSAETKLTATAWASYYSRWSSRQRGGGFGTLPTGADANSTTNELQEFYTQGIEMRLRHDYQWAGGEHTIAGGVQVYHTDSPRQERRGVNSGDRGGPVNYDADREVLYAPVFLENRFQWGPLSIVPGVRFENFWQEVQENVNVSKINDGQPLADQEDGEFEPLFGLGISYEVAKSVEIYGNVAQSYRPKIYTQAVPTGGTTLVPNDLEAGKAWQYEIGFRGRPAPWVSWDVSAFLLDFDNQIGNIALPGGFSTVANVGRAQHRGVEAAFELDLIGLADALRGTPGPAPSGKDKTVVPAERSLTERFGSLSLYANATWLDAEFVSGPLDGLTPRFAPDYLVRAGVIYRWQDRVKVALLGTMVGDAFADDANTPERYIPAYMTWDLTAEAKVYKDIVSVQAGINNLFDEDYYARIRDDGIDPAYGRNYYVGFSLSF
jgi:Fe(3+) dicitrate transport protein